MEEHTSYSEVWSSNYTSIRRVVLHPIFPEQMAMLRCNESVLYYQHCFEGQYNVNEVPIHLVAAELRGVCCGAFRPWSDKLALGCALGVCLWDLPRNEEMYNRIGMERIPCGKSQRCEDYVKELQWLNDGCHLACAVSKSVEIWDPDALQLLQILEMPKSESYMWIMRFKPDMEEFLMALEDTGYEWIFISHLDTLLTQKLQLQSAVWTNDGDHLIFAAICDCRIFITSPRDQRQLFLCPNLSPWHTEVVLRLNYVKCGGKIRYCCDPVALAIDPNDAIVAIMFKRQPFVLLCLLDIRLGLPVKLRPLRFLDHQPEISFEVYPTCMCFFPAQENGDCTLFVAWTNGDHFIKTISPTPMPTELESESESGSESGSKSGSKSSSESELELEDVEMEDRTVS